MAVVAVEDIESKYADDALDQEEQLTVCRAIGLLQSSVWSQLDTIDKALVCRLMVV